MFTIMETHWQTLKRLSVAGIWYAAVVKQAVFKRWCEHKAAGKNESCTLTLDKRFKNSTNLHTGQEVVQ